MTKLGSSHPALLQALPEVNTVSPTVVLKVMQYMCSQGMQSASSGSGST